MIYSTHRHIVDLYWYLWLYTCDVCVKNPACSLILGTSAKGGWWGSWVVRPLRCSVGRCWLATPLRQNHLVVLRSGTGVLNCGYWAVSPEPLGTDCRSYSFCKQCLTCFGHRSFKLFTASLTIYRGCRQCLICCGPGTLRLSTAWLALYRGCKQCLMCCGHRTFKWFTAWLTVYRGCKQCLMCCGHRTLKRFTAWLDCLQGL